MSNARPDGPSPDALDASVRLARLRREMFAQAEQPRIADYHVLRSIGGGGMGLVYAAWDPSLDRVIAIKVLRDPSAPRAASRLRREAVALARLRHPNVVSVFEVGEHEGQVYLAMEYVAGQTLREWVQEWSRKGRDLAALYDVFIQAARGLMGAHAAGIVHGDVKPENVMVDAEGRVRLMDFGLARRGSTDDTDEERSPTLDTDTTLTDHTAGRHGTPAYMAPEQLRGISPGPAADQYALCACLFEALYLRRARPDRLKDAAELADEPVAVAPERGVPRRLQAVLRRGLAVDPGARWASMHALADELARLRRPPIGRRIVGASLAIAVAGVLGGVALSPREEPPCTGQAQDVLTDDDRAAVAAAFEAHPPRRAADLVSRVVAQLDAYATAWTEMVDASCRATFVERQQSTLVFDQRLQCLERRRHRLRAAVDALRDAETAYELGERTMLAFRLPELQGCADLEALAAEVPLPADPDERERALGLREELDAATTLLELGDFAGASEAATAVATAARELQQPSTLAEALTLFASAEDSAGPSREAEAAVREAILIAAEAGDAKAEAFAWTELLFNLMQQGKVRAGLDQAFAARAAVARSGDPVARGWMLNNLGSLHGQDLDHFRALEVFREAVALKEQTLGPDHVDVAISQYNLGNALNRCGRFEDAIAPFEDAQTILEGTVGRAHPLAYHVLSGQCRADAALGRTEAAIARCEEALQGFEAAGLTERTIGIEFTLARALWAAGRRAEARATAERSRRRAEATDWSTWASEIASWEADPQMFETLDASRLTIEAAASRVRPADP